MKSSEYGFARNAMNDGAVYVMYATMILNDGNASTRTQLCLTPTEFTVSSNNTISSGSTSKGLPIGQVMSRALTFELINGRYYNDNGVAQPRPFSTYGGLRAYFITNQKASAPDISFTNRVASSKGDNDIVDYYGATFNMRLVLMKNGTAVVDSAVQEGNFYVFQDADYGNVVVINAMDELYRTDKAYYPNDIYEGLEAYISEWFKDACTSAGLNYNASSVTLLRNTNKYWKYNSEKLMTCRELIGYLAMMVGGNVVYEYNSSNARYEVTIKQYSMIPSYESTSKTVYSTTNNYRLLDTGYRSSNSSYKLSAYSVRAGDYLEINSDDKFQFQTSSSTTTSGTLYRVGATYGTGRFYITVPDTATYLIVSTLKTGSQATVRTPYDNKSFAIIDWFNLDTSLVNVYVTGVKTVVDKEEVMAGTDGYVIVLTNPLISSIGNETYDSGVTKDAEQNVRDIYSAIGSNPFRIFSGEIKNFPFAEYMDTIRFYDVIGTEYVSVLTNIDYTLNGVTKLANTANTPTRVGLALNSSASQIVQLQGSISQTSQDIQTVQDDVGGLQTDVDGLQTDVGGLQTDVGGLQTDVTNLQGGLEREQSERERVEEEFQSALLNSYGFYSTTKEDAMGAYTWYLHDKSDLDASSTVFKINAKGIGISNDGVNGEYKYGFTASGNAIMDIISSNYILADWIKAGRLTIINPSNNTTVFDVDTGWVVGEHNGVYEPYYDHEPSITMNAGSVNIATTGSTLENYVDNLEAHGVSKVETGNHYTFDDDGLKITSSVGDLQNTLDETGMTIKGRNDTTGDYDVDLLTVTYQGVVMDNATVETEFTIGDWKFKKDPNVSSTYMGCFYVGG